jgi:SAM-dependent methyltransferase
MSRRDHWNTVYTTKGEQQTAWFEALPALSLQMMEAAGLTPETCVIDVGGGDSRLVDLLVAQGLHCLAVLDVSGTALRRAQARLGTAASTVAWIEADVTTDWSFKPVDIWHDRAVFHFLTEPEDRRRYLSRLDRTLKRGGSAIMATFALDGPDRCSGLPVVRYSPETLATGLGPDFELVEHLPHIHQTPWGNSQSFQYSRFRHLSDSQSGVIAS